MSTQWAPNQRSSFASGRGMLNLTHPEVTTFWSLPQSKGEMEEEVKGAPFPRMLCPRGSGCSRGRPAARRDHSVVKHRGGEVLFPEFHRSHRCTPLGTATRAQK